MDVFVLPSISEGCPIVLLEAMSMGLPVVATRVGGVPEVINGKAGLIVPLRNSKDIADSVYYLLSHHNVRIKIGRNGRKRVERMFSLDKCVESHKKVYDFALA